MPSDRTRKAIPSPRFALAMYQRRKVRCWIDVTLFAMGGEAPRRARTRRPTHIAVQPS
ncbi:hypothetical protein [Streptomyces sp. uw30]|uniref:hypothetical protein n=1 Tax=Streptomyces sp. uw30 TaxID=1828179 RepID=UPI00165118E7